jgi:hypothetical protein
VHQLSSLFTTVQFVLLGAEELGCADQHRDVRIVPAGRMAPTIGDRSTLSLHLQAHSLTML